jgi:hypothetical protein
MAKMFASIFIVRPTACMKVDQEGDAKYSSAERNEETLSRNVYF